MSYSCHLLTRTYKIIILCLVNEIQMKRFKIKIAGLSFHSVLRQPQSDQAVSGIVSLLQARMPSSQLEILQEEERTRENPLLVVLYNLSNVITDAKSALSGIEGIYYSCMFRFNI